MLNTLVKENYYLSKYLHTSYKDLDEITWTERNLLLTFIQDDMKREQDTISSIKDKFGNK